jgi:YjbE family integral membrane protein
MMFDADFVFAFLSIFLIDLILAGDNAVIIALAVRNLPPPQKRAGMLLGAGGAVLLRVVLTFFIAQLLTISFLKFIGGILVIWIAVKLFAEKPQEDKIHRETKTLKQAIVTIMIADFVMSTDNVLAIAGASGGNFYLILFGLLLSIPFVVFTSSLLSRLMEKYPVILYIGVAVLGRVAGEMMITDPYIVKLFDPGKMTEYSVQAIFAAGVIAMGILRDKWAIITAQMKSASRLPGLRRAEPEELPKAFLRETKGLLPGEEIRP